LSSIRLKHLTVASWQHVPDGFKMAAHGSSDEFDNLHWMLVWLISLDMTRSKLVRLLPQPPSLSSYTFSAARVSWPSATFLRTLKKLTRPKVKASPQRPASTIVATAQ